MEGNRFGEDRNYKMNVSVLKLLINAPVKLRTNARVFVRQQTASLRGHPQVKRNVTLDSKFSYCFADDLD